MSSNNVELLVMGFTLHPLRMAASPIQMCPYICNSNYFLPLLLSFILFFFLVWSFSQQRAGFLFLCFNYLWYVGLPMKGMIPAEASAAANSSFAWVYLLSIFLLHEKVDWVKLLAVLGCLGGVVLLAISGWLETLPKNVTHAHHHNHSVRTPMQPITTRARARTRTNTLQFCVPCV